MNEILPSTEFTYGKCDGNKNDAFGACTSQSQGLEMVAQKYDACLHPVPVTPTANINSEYFCKTGFLQNSDFFVKKSLFDEKNHQIREGFKKKKLVEFSTKGLPPPRP